MLRLVREYLLVLAQQTLPFLPLMSFPRPGNENLRGAMRIRVQDNESAAVDMLALLECLLTEGAGAAIGVGSAAGALEAALQQLQPPTQAQR
jgi:hypothetical protein